MEYKIMAVVIAFATVVLLSLTQSGTCYIPPTDNDTYVEHDAISVVFQSNKARLRASEPPVGSLKSISKFDVPTITDGRVSKNEDAPPEYELHRWLFHNYSATCRPRKNSAKPVEVNLQLDLFAVNDMQEKQHAVVVTGTLNVVWYDDFLVWDNHPNFSKIDLLVATPDEVWLPDFAMITAPDMYTLKLAKGINVNVYSNGQITFNPKTSFVSTCEFDLTFFPFDRQQCRIAFESWTYLPKAQYFVLYNPPITLDKFVRNEQWDMDDAVANAYINCPENATGAACNAGVEFILALSRKPPYYIINIVVPSIIISIAEVSTFVLPLEEAMKIHISFTCLLAFSVFQTAINIDMPRTSDNTPLLSDYIVLTMAYIAFAILGETFVFFCLSLAEEKKPVPRSVEVIFRVIGKLILLSVDSVNTESVEIAMKHDDFEIDFLKASEANMPLSIKAAIMKTAEYKTMQEKYGVMHVNAIVDRLVSIGKSPLDSMTTNDNNNKSDRKKERGGCDWIFVARVSSRLTSVLYVLLVVLTPIFMLLATPISQVKWLPLMGNLTVSP